jgi:hypothetical protein
MVAGAQGGGYALSIWMPTYLRTVRGLSSTSTGGFLIVQILGALVGFLIGSYLADYIGRKGTFVWSAVAFCDGPRVSARANGQHRAVLARRSAEYRPAAKFPPMGPFMTELYPTKIRAPGRLLLQPGVPPARCFQRWSGI